MPPEKVFEKSEEVRITVQKYLKKREGGGEEVVEASLGPAPVEQLQNETTSAPPAASDALETPANGAA